MDHIRGKQVEHARAMLTHTPRAAAGDVLKLLDSAIANAENNHELVADELRSHGLSSTRARRSSATVRALWAGPRRSASARAT